MKNITETNNCKKIQNNEIPMKYYNQESLAGILKYSIS